jgi:hypothetical protein
MNLRLQVKRLEQQAVQMSERELCPHLPPVIHRADGSIENDALHDCGKPRLTITVGYSDGSDQRTQDSALETFDLLRREYSDILPQQVAERIMRCFTLTPETRAALLERVRAESHEHTN